MTKAVISLTPETLAVLFPEGSEARIDLQRATLKVAAERFCKGAIAEQDQDFLREVVKDQRAATLEALYERCGLGPTSCFHTTGVEVLSADTHEALRRHIKALVSSAISERISQLKIELVNAAVEAGQEYMQANLGAEVERQAKKALSAQLVEKVNAALLDFSKLERKDPTQETKG